MNGLATLAEAIRWAEDHWHGRPLPLRLHDRAVEPESLLGSPRMTSLMMSYLLAQPDQTEERTETILCDHPRQAGAACPDCEGGVKDRTAVRYRYPMWRALWKLSYCEPLTEGQAKPVWIVLALWAAGWEPGRVMLHLPPDERNDLLLTCLRKLHGRYEETPVPRVGWTDRSESQRRAEEVVAA